MKKCQTCKQDLVDGPDVERSFEAEGISCVVTGIPTKRCPAGCEGLYWYWPDFGVEILDGLSEKSENIAQRKLGFLKTRQLCRMCHGELVGPHQNETFDFPVLLDKGTTAHLRVRAPALRCPTCQKVYLPANTGRTDPYYPKLWHVIEKTITKDLIHR
jgi:hypothetical protein